MSLHTRLSVSKKSLGQSKIRGDEQKVVDHTHEHLYIDQNQLGANQLSVQISYTIGAVDIA